MKTLLFITGLTLGQFAMAATYTVTGADLAGFCATPESGLMTMVANGKPVCIKMAIPNVGDDINDLIFKGAEDFFNENEAAGNSNVSLIVTGNESSNGTLYVTNISYPSHVYPSCTIHSISRGLWSDGGPLITVQCGTQFVTVNPFDIAVLLGQAKTPDNASRAADSVANAGQNQNIFLSAVSSSLNNSTGRTSLKLYTDFNLAAAAAKADFAQTNGKQ